MRHCGLRTPCQMRSPGWPTANVTTARARVPTPVCHVRHTSLSGTVSTNDAGDVAPCAPRSGRPTEVGPGRAGLWPARTGGPPHPARRARPGWGGRPGAENLGGKKSATLPEGTVDRAGRSPHTLYVGPRCPGSRQSARSASNGRGWRGDARLLSSCKSCARSARRDRRRCTMGTAVRGVAARLVRPTGGKVSRSGAERY